MARIKVRKGMPSVALTKAEFTRRARERFVDPGLRCRCRMKSPRSSTRRGTAITTTASRRYTKRAGPRFADPDYELSIDWLKARDAVARAERRQKSTGVTLAHPAGQRLLTQRPDLPRRDVQDLPAGRDRPARDRARARLRGRAARPQPAHLAVRAADPALQGLRVDGACRSATGPAPAIPTMRWARSTTGWPRSIPSGWRRTAS